MLVYALSEQERERERELSKLSIVIILAKSSTLSIKFEQPDLFLLFQRDRYAGW